MTFQDDQRTRWRGRRVFVTGATGFVGRALIGRLGALGADVTGLVRSPAADPPAADIEVVVGRLEDYAVLERAILECGFDVVFHLGAQAIVDAARRDPRATLESNVAGTWNLLEACRRARTMPRVVMASTDRLYRAPAQAAAGRSEGVLDVYGVSKLCAEQIASTYAMAYDLPMVIARTANVFGPEDVNVSRLVPGIIQAVLLGKRPVILSDGSPVHDYIYVKDAGEAYLSLADQLDRPAMQGKVVNVGSGRKTSVLELTRTILSLMGRAGVEPEIRGRSSAVRSSSEVAWVGVERLDGWEPHYSLEQGLEETIAWYRDHPERISGAATC